MPYNKNRGEWSEFYALAKLLERGELIAGYGEPGAAEQRYALHAVAKSPDGFRYRRQGDYIIALRCEGGLLVPVDPAEFPPIPLAALSTAARVFMTEIQEGAGRAFACPLSESFFSEQLRCPLIPTAAGVKRDISFSYLQGGTPQPEELGFSIKSYLGGRPSLVNASHSTRFVFDVEGMSLKAALAHNEIADIRARVIALRKSGTLSYKGVMHNRQFQLNLAIVESHLHYLLAELLLCHFSGHGSWFSEIEIENAEPRLYGNCPQTADFSLVKFRMAIQSYLRAASLGMVPRKAWDGWPTAEGGYLIVKSDGELVGILGGFAERLGKFLYDHCYLETPSTSKWHYGTVYEHNGTPKIMLALQVRIAPKRHTAALPN